MTDLSEIKEPPAIDLIDWLTYISYATQRDNGMSIEGAAKIYPNAAAYEERYFMECVDEDRRYSQPEPREAGRFTRWGEEIPE